MSWIKKSSDVEVQAELEFSNTNITETNAYKATITEAYLQNSKDEQSKSVQLVINAKTEDEQTVKTYFTIMGRDGNIYYTGSVAGKQVKKQHFGLSIADSLFKIVLGKEIFDCEPSDTKAKKWNAEAKAMEEVEVTGFPELMGKEIGLCVQMNREIKGAKSREYPEIKHFFDNATGLMSGEEAGKPRSKLDGWLAGMKEFIITEVQDVAQSSFGKASTTEAKAPKKSGWGK